MSPWRGRRVFVTGATGLLGGWLVEALLEAGAEVVALVRDGVPETRFVERGLAARATVVRGELERHPLLVRVLHEYEIDSVFHLGAQTVVGTASVSPLATFEANVRGTWNLLEACRDARRRVERVVFASSDKAYGASLGRASREDDPLLGRAPYDASKAAADRIAQSYAASYGVPVAVTRCANLFGGGDLNWNRLVPGTIRSALRAERPILRSDGTLVRDYLYVRDAVAAYLALAEAIPGSALAGQAFNFGGGTGWRADDLARLVLRIAGRPDLEPEIQNVAVGEIQHQVLDSTKARETLGWTPAWSLERGLAETVEWYRAREARG